MSVAALIAAQQEHSPPAGAHLLLVAGVIVAALAVVGVKWWRGRSDAAARAERQAPSHDRPADSRRSSHKK
jgi:hypothetical protein